MKSPSSLAFSLSLFFLSLLFSVVPLHLCWSKNSSTACQFALQACVLEKQTKSKKSLLKFSRVSVSRGFFGGFVLLLVRTWIRTGCLLTRPSVCARVSYDCVRWDLPFNCKMTGCNVDKPCGTSADLSSVRSCSPDSGVRFCLCLSPLSQIFRLAAMIRLALVFHGWVVTRK